MFGKISKVVLGMGLIGGVMSGNCSTLETLLPRAIHSPRVSLQPMPQVSPYAPASNDKDTYILEIPKGSIKSQDITNILDMLIKNPLALDKLEQLFMQPTRSQSNGNDYEGKGMSEEKLAKGTSEENFEESDDNYPFEQLQEHMFLGINSYLRDTSDSDAKTIIKGTLKRMLSHREGHTDEELLEEILPLNEYEESRGLYHELQTMIVAGK